MHDPWSNRRRRFSAVEYLPLVFTTNALLPGEELGARSLFLKERSMVVTESANKVKAVSGQLLGSAKAKRVASAKVPSLRKPSSPSSEQYVPGAAESSKSQGGQAHV